MKNKIEFLTEEEIYHYFTERIRDIDTQREIIEDKVIDIVCGLSEVTDDKDEIFEQLTKYGKKIDGLNSIGIRLMHAWTVALMELRKKNDD